MVAVLVQWVRVVRVNVGHMANKGFPFSYNEVTKPRFFGCSTPKHVPSDTLYPVFYGLTPYFVAGSKELLSD